MTTISQSYRVTFDRIGRRHDVEPLTFTAVNADEAAEHVYRYARQFLGSKDVDVVVDIATGRVDIGAGRFGSGSIEQVAEVAR